MLRQAFPSHLSSLYPHVSQNGCLGALYRLKDAATAEISSNIKLPAWGGVSGFNKRLDLEAYVTIPSDGGKTRRIMCPEAEKFALQFYGCYVPKLVATQDLVGTVEPCTIGYSTYEKTMFDLIQAFGELITDSSTGRYTGLRTSPVATMTPGGGTSEVRLLFGLGRMGDQDSDLKGLLNVLSLDRHSHYRPFPPIHTFAILPDLPGLRYHSQQQRQSRDGYEQGPLRPRLGQCPRQCFKPVPRRRSGVVRHLQQPTARRTWPMCVVCAMYVRLRVCLCLSSVSDHGHV